MDFVWSSVMSERSQIVFRRALVISGFLFFVLAAIRGMLYDQPRIGDLVLSVATGAVVVKFCIVDYRVRGRTLLRSFHWLIFFTWPFALPIYLLWSRGVARGMLAVLLLLAGAFVSYAVAFTILCMAVAMSG